MSEQGRYEKKPTIYDVAELVGVSPSTVSRALARPGRVSAATAERVRKGAQEIGYGQSSARTAAASLPSKLLAIVVADIGNPVFHDVIRGAEQVASRAGYTVLLFDAQESDSRERRAAEQFLFAVEGMLLASPRLPDSGIRAIAKQRPIVTLNRQVQGLPSVVTDSARGSYYAVEHLADLGHTSLTYVAGPESAWSEGARWRGAQEAAAELGLRARRIRPDAPTVAGGEQAARMWAEAPTTGVLCYNDIMAAGFIRGLWTLGVDVPGEVSVIGFDNTLTARLSTPALTSIAPPVDLLGEIGASNLIAIINGAKSANEPVRLPVKLVVRESTGPAPVKV